MSAKEQTFWIMACHKENTDEKTIVNMVTERALRDGNRVLGTAIELDRTRVDKT